VHQFRFRAVITLDPAKPRPGALHPPAQQFSSHTHALMVLARPLRYAGSARHFTAETCWDSEGPLRAGDRAWVTVTVTDDEAGGYFEAGQQFILWSGGEVGHGTVARRVFTDNSPS
jgi:hypothetical protein